MAIEIPINNRNRQYALFTWPIFLNSEIIALFNNQETIDVSVRGAKKQTTKRVSYKYRRFTIGHKVLRQFKLQTHFSLERKGNVIYIDFIVK